MQIDQLSPYVLAADIGGSHITAGLCNRNSYNVAEESLIRMGVESKGSANEILSAWEKAFNAILTTTNRPVAALAIAMPGPFDYQNGISYIKGLSKYESIYGMDIKNHLGNALNLDAELIYFRNDAESAIAGEVLAGAGKNYDKLIGITLGTGFGSAFSESKVTKDLNLGSDKYRDSIADDYFSTRWFVKRYQELTGETLTGGVKELSAIAHKNEPAKAIFDQFADNLSEFLIKPVWQLQPNALVICGNIAKASRFFLGRLSDNLKPLNITFAQLDEAAPLIGATAIVKKPSTDQKNK